jgi:hypothetical protein
MVSERLPKGVAREIAELPDLPRDALAERWLAFYGIPPFKTMSKDLLVRAIAYEMQVQDQGGLTAAEKKALLALAEGKADHGGAGLKPGTRLYRRWQGITQEVLVSESGYGWRGKSYASLPEVARAITGSRWSGPRFFGLKA